MHIKYVTVYLMLFALPLLSGCEKNAAGRSALIIMPSSVLNSQSAQIYADKKKNEAISPNKRQTKIVKRVAQRLIQIASTDYAYYSKGYKWEVTLFDAPKTVNAYCMPGGKIGIYTGILEVCENEAALAAVMGHEIAHALLRHGNERVSQQLLIAGGTIASKYAMDEYSDFSSTQKRSIMIAVGLGSEFGIALPYSRMHERESDSLGLELMAKAGYLPSEAPALWKRMGAANKSSMPEILSTHPATESRIHDLSQLQNKARAFYRQAPHTYGKGEDLRK